MEKTNALLSHARSMVANFIGLCKRTLFFYKDFYQSESTIFYQFGLLQLFFATVIYENIRILCQLGCLASLDRCSYYQPSIGNQFFQKTLPETNKCPE